MHVNLAGSQEPGGQETQAAAPAGAEEDNMEEEVDEDALGKMSTRQHKLYELKAKLGQCRKANQNAVIAEKKRERVRACVLAEGLRSWT